MNHEQNPQQAEEHAQNLQRDIDDLNMKAQSSSGAEKEGYMNRIKILSEKKDTLMKQANDWKERGKGFFDKLGM